MHALLVGIGVTLLGLLGAPTEAWLGAGTGMFGLAAAVICNAIYAHALKGRPRSDERATGDRRRAVMMLIALPVPIAFAFAAAVNGQLRAAESVLHDSSVAAFVACLVVVAFALLYVSSTIDWYVVKAWRDGIVIDPPCKRRGNRPTWLLITRVWLLHRIFATIGFFVALWTTVGLAWFEMLKHHGNSDWAIYLLGLVSPSAIPLFFMRSYIANLGHAVGLAFGNLRLSLSDRASWNDYGEHSEGIAYDVSIDLGYRMIDREGRFQYLPLATARSGNISIDETDPESWACDAVRASDLMGASDHWAPRTHGSTRGLILR